MKEQSLKILNNSKSKIKIQNNEHEKIRRNWKSIRFIVFWYLKALNDGTNLIIMKISPKSIKFGLDFFDSSLRLLNIERKARRKISRIGQITTSI